MDKVETAIELARLGFNIFPLLFNSKVPAISGFPERATRDEVQLRKWWSVNKNRNIGISTTRFWEDEALFVIDVDNKPGKNGDASILELEINGKSFPRTREHSTASGGRHIIYRTPHPLKQGVNVFGNGLDTRSKGGYIVAPGSTIDDKTYAVVRDETVAPAPDWIVGSVDRADTTPARASIVLPNIDADKAEARGVNYMKSLGWSHVGSRNDDLFRIAARLKDLGCNPDQALWLIIEHWKCDTETDDDKIMQIVANAFRYGKEPQGSSAPEAVFDAIAPRGDGDEPVALHPLDAVNVDHAFVLNGGYVFKERIHPIGQYLLIDRYNQSNFFANFANREFMIGNKATTLAKAWWSWPDRRSFEDVVFAPESVLPPQYYNVWRGFSYAPADTPDHPSVRMFKEHALENVCAGDMKLFNWLMGFFAHVIQKPMEKPLVAPVFRGGKGVGKNALVERVGALLLRHFIVADDNRYLIGNFNSYLETCLMLVLDEACWAGDKKAEGRLKGLITGTYHNIERKGHEPYQALNLTRVVIIGNEDWLVPASEDERRFAVFDVGDKRKQDREFFYNMRVGMEDGGYRHLLRYLLDFDLSSFDSNAAPNTPGLLRQKDESLGLIEGWWLDCLESDELIGGDFDGPLPARTATNRMMKAFHNAMKGQNVRSRLPGSKKFNATMSRIAPSLKYKKIHKPELGDHSYAYVHDGIEKLRADFDRFMKSNRDWSKKETEQ